MDGKTLDSFDDMNFLDDVSTSTISPENLPKNSKLSEEMTLYEKLQQSLKGKYSDPLDFWTEHDSKFPILSRIARVILSISPTSADVERLFSRSGRTATEGHSSLIPDHVNELVTLNYWLRETEERLHNLTDGSAVSYAKMKAAEFYKKFVTLGLDLELRDS